MMGRITGASGDCKGFTVDDDDDDWKDVDHGDDDCDGRDCGDAGASKAAGCDGGWWPAVQTNFTKLKLCRSTLSSPASPSASVALNFYELSLQCNWQEMLCNSTQNQKPVQQISLKSHPCSSGNGEGFKLLKRRRNCFKVLMQDKHI